MSDGIKSSKSIPFGDRINEVTIGNTKFLELEKKGVDGIEKGTKIKVDGVLFVIENSVAGLKDEFLQVIIDGEVQYLDTSLQIVSSDIHNLLETALNGEC